MGIGLVFISLNPEIKDTALSEQLAYTVMVTIAVSSG